MSVSVGTRSLSERAIEVLRRSGNPFRNYFARNPDDEVCSRYHVPELFATERDQLLGVVDLYRYDPTTHSEVVPVLGNKGAGKTHLLHSIKHGNDGAWQLLVTPGTYHKDTDFLEFLLFQVIDTLLGGGKQRGNRPLEFVGEELCRQLLRPAIEGLTSQERLDLFPAPGLGPLGTAPGSWGIASPGADAVAARQPRTSRPPQWPAGAKRQTDVSRVRPRTAAGVRNSLRTH